VLIPYGWFRDSVPLLSTGASVLILLPSAFVSLSSSAVDALEPFSRLRIVAAGPFHNLIFWCVLVAATKVGIGSVIWSIPYIDISSRGRVAVTVDQVGAFLFTVS
jgi:S2P endopeptidase